MQVAKLEGELRQKDEELRASVKEANVSRRPPCPCSTDGASSRPKTPDHGPSCPSFPQAHKEETARMADELEQMRKDLETARRQAANLDAKIQQAEHHVKQAREGRGCPLPPM